MSAVAIGIISLGFSALSTGTSFVQSGQQKKMAEKAQREADKAMANARKRLQKNAQKGIGLPFEIFEQSAEQRKTGLSSILKAAREGDERGVASTAGRTMAIAAAGEEKDRAAMSNELFKRQIAEAQEEARLRDMNVGLDIGEIKGQQAQAQASQAQADRALQAGFVGLGNMAGQAASLIGENRPKTPEGRAAKRFENQYKKALRKGDIAAGTSMQDFATNRLQAMTGVDNDYSALQEQISQGAFDFEGAFNPLEMFQDPGLGYGNMNMWDRMSFRRGFNY